MRAMRECPSGDPVTTGHLTTGSSPPQPVEREALVYSLDCGPLRPDPHHQLSDDFFEVTVDDIRKRFAQLKSERLVTLTLPLTLL